MEEEAEQCKEMPYVQSFLKRRCNELVSFQEKNADDKNLFIAGKIDEFSMAEINNLERKFSIVISNDYVIIMLKTGKVHCMTQRNVQSFLNAAFLEKYGILFSQPAIADELPVVNLNECHKSFIKIPDGGILIRRDSRQGYPLLVVEVGHYANNMDFLLRIAEIYLNPHTHIDYVLLVNVLSVQRRVQSIGFVLCTRISNLSDMSQSMQIFHGLAKCNKQDHGKFGSRRKSEVDLLRATFEEIQDIYDVLVLFDNTVERNSLHNVTFSLSEDVIFRDIPNPHNFNQFLEISISEMLLQDIVDI